MNNIVKSFLPFSVFIAVFSCSGEKIDPISGGASKNDPKSVSVTGDANNITETSASLSGFANLTSDMTGDVVLGVCYSTDPNPDQKNGVSTTTNELGSNNKFTVEATGLLPDTKYYYKAFVHRNSIYTYGDTKTFNTLRLNASVTAEDASNVFADMATLNANFQLEAKGKISPSDVCFFIGSDNSLEMLKQNGQKYDASFTENNKFSVLINNLTGNTKYYYVASINFSGTILYSNIQSFTTAKVEVNVDPKELHFEKEGGSSTVSLKASGAWKISNPAYEWLSLSIYQGTASASTINIIVNVNENKGSNRSADLVLQCSGEETILKVSQDGKFGPIEGDGTQDSPLNVAKAYALTQYFAYIGGQPTDYLYVKGTVSEIVSTGSYMTYKIIDKDYPDGQLKVGDGASINGRYFSDESYLSVGDKVIVYAKIDSYGIMAYSRLYALNGYAYGGYTGRLRFTLDMNDHTIIVQETSEPITTEHDQPYLYSGSNYEGIGFKYDSAGIYSLIVDFDSDWGFLIMDYYNNWEYDYVWGGDGNPVHFGQKYQLRNGKQRLDCYFAIPIEVSW